MGLDWDCRTYQILQTNGISKISAPPEMERFYFTSTYPANQGTSTERACILSLSFPHHNM